MFIDPTKPIIDPQLGDVTREVIAELNEMNRLGTPDELTVRQAKLANALGNEAREFAGGHSIAQIDSEVFMRWVARDGLTEALNGRVDWARKHFPGAKMVYKSARPTVRVSGFGRGGRWHS